MLLSKLKSQHSDVDLLATSDQIPGDPKNEKALAKGNRGEVLSLCACNPPI
jgi:hypothetical protein